MKIRLAKDEDYAAIARLRRQTIRYVNAQDYSEEIIRNWAARADTASFRKAHDDCKRWVALSQDKIIAFCEHDFNGELSRLYTHKDYLRQGVASRLLKAAKKSLAKRGCKTICLESTITAKNFYEKHGYKVTRKTQSSVDAATVYKMLKKTSPDT